MNGGVPDRLVLGFSEYICEATRIYYLKHPKPNQLFPTSRPVLAHHVVIQCLSRWESLHCCDQRPWNLDPDAKTVHQIWRQSYARLVGVERQLWTIPRIQMGKTPKDLAGY